jgi:hypothetical protein
VKNIRKVPARHFLVEKNFAFDSTSFCGVTLAQRSKAVEVKELWGIYESAGSLSTVNKSILLEVLNSFLERSPTHVVTLAEYGFVVHRSPWLVIAGEYFIFKVMVDSILLCHALLFHGSSWLFKSASNTKD